MINLRYHIVSITAVFLALGIGVALGSTLIERATVETLNDRLDEQAARLDRTDGENERLREELAEVEELQDRLVLEGRTLLDRHLTDVPVVILTVQGTDDELLETTRASLRASGATVTGAVRFTSRWESLSDDEVAELSGLIDRTLTSGDVARALVLSRLVDELAAVAAPPDADPPDDGPEGGPGDESPEGGPGDAEDPGRGQGDGDAAPEGEQPDGDQPDGDQPDGGPGDEMDEPEHVGELLDALIEAGFAEFQPDAAGAPLPASGARYVVVADDGREIDHETVLLELLGDMARALPAGVVVAEPLVDEEPGDEVPLPGPLVAAIRADDALRAAVTTVDAPRRFVGQAAIVLGVARQVDDGDATVGHYGLAEGSTSLLPPVEE